MNAALMLGQEKERAVSPEMSGETVGLKLECADTDQVDHVDHVAHDTFVAAQVELSLAEFSFSLPLGHPFWKNGIWVIL